MFEITQPETTWTPGNVTEREERDVKTMARGLRDSVGVDTYNEMVLALALPLEDFLRRTDPNNPALALIDQHHERVKLGLA